MSTDDRTEIRQVITQYAEAYLRADVDALRDVFAPDAIMNGHVGERLVEGEPEIFIQNVGRAPSIFSLGQNSRYEIGDIQITGHAAAVTVTQYDFGDFNFTDYMHLLKRDGRWQIISKTFSTF
jgi:ketosteroid isomerase-like protein